MIEIEGGREQKGWGMKETTDYVRQNLNADESNREEILEYLLSRHEFDAEKTIYLIDFVTKKRNQEKNLENIVKQYISEGKDDEVIMAKLAGKSTDALGLVTVLELAELIQKLRSKI